MAIYMKIEGIDGNITAKSHEKWIEILEFSFGLGRAITSTEPGHQSNREGTIPSFTEITVRKVVDETSPKIFLEACIGKAQTKPIQMEFCHSGDTLLKYASFKLTDVLISSYEIDGRDDGHPLERFTLNYSAIEMEYIPYDDKEAPKTSIRGGYNLITAGKSS